MASSEDVEAANVTFTDIPEDKKIVDSGNYFVNEAMTLTGEKNIKISVYIAAAVELTIDSDTMTVDVYFADSAVKEEVTTDSPKIATALVSDGALTATITNFGPADKAITLAGDADVITVTPADGIAINTAGITYDGALFTLASGVATYTSYPASTYGLKEGDVLIVKSGNTTVSCGNSIVKLEGYGDELLFSSEEGVTFTYEENEVVASGVIATGELYVSTGFMKAGAATLRYAIVDDAVITGVTTAPVALDAGILAIPAGQEVTNVPKIIPSEPEDIEFGVIMGDFVHPDKNPKIAQDLTINSGALLTIPVKSTFTIGNKNVDDLTITMMDFSAIDIWGTVKGVAGSDGDYPLLKSDVVPVDPDTQRYVKIRAGAEITGIRGHDDNVIGLEAPAIEDDKDLYGISGTLTSNTTVTNAEIPEGKMLTIPAGITLTVTEMLVINSDLGMVINGTLVIADGAMLASNAGTEAGEIILGETGTIVNNGIIAKYNPVVIADEDGCSVTFAGIDGLVFDTIDLLLTYDIGVSGNLTPIAGSNGSMVVFDGVIFNGNVTIGKDVIAVIDGDSLLSEYTMVVDGSLFIEEDVDLVLDAGSTLTVNGYIVTAEEGRIYAATTDLDGTTVKDGDWGETLIDLSVGAATKAEADPTIHFLTGYTIEVIAIPFTEAGKAMVIQSVFISGDLAVTPAVGTGYALTTPATLNVDGDNPVVVGLGDELVQNVTNAYVVSEVPVDVIGKVISINEIDVEDNVVGALYTVTVENVTKYYVVDWNTGLDGIAGYDEKTVVLLGLEGLEADLDGSLNILEGETVELYGVEGFMTIPEGVVLYVSNGGVFDADIIGKLDGKIIVEADGDCVPAPGLYEVYSEDEDETVTYSGFLTALAEAEAGDTITISGIYTADSLTIPAGINVVVEGGLVITKNLTISAGATLTVEGAIVVGDEEVKNTKVLNNGTFDVSPAFSATFYSYAEDANALQITSDGDFIYQTTQDFPANTKFVGVTYVDGTKTVLTSIDNAIEAGVEEIVIDGEYTSDEAIVLDDTKLTVNGKATFAAIDIADGELEVAGTLTATVTGSVGEVVVLTGFTGTITDGVVGGVSIMTIEAMTAGSIEVKAGDVTVTAADITIADNKFLLVDEGSELIFAANSTVAVAEEGLVDINGILTVNKDKEVAINGGTILLDGAVVVNGDLTISESIVMGVINVFGTFTAGDMLLLGSIAVDDSAESTATATFHDVVMGAAAVGAAPEILGKKITLAEGCALVVFPGATVAPSTVSDLKSTEFYANGVLYVTAYANAGEVNAVAADGIITDVIPMEGYDMTGSDVAENWTDITGAAIAANTKVGAKAALFFEGVQLTAKVIVSTTTGTSVFVDGVKYASGTTINDVAVGVHTVKVTIDPGYKGTTEVTFNGKVLSGLMVFEITPEMVGPTAKYVLSVTGDIVIDEPVVPEQEKEDNTIIMVLLAVLVVMVVILAIVVILRMMRS